MVTIDPPPGAAILKRGQGEDFILKFPCALSTDTLKIMAAPGRLSRKQVRLLWVVGGGSALAFGVFLLVFVVLPVLGITKTLRLPNDGMSPALQSGDVVYTRLKDGIKPTRDSIVFFEPPKHPLTAGYGGIWVSRCVGLPGDTLEVVDGEVLVNGKLVGLNPRRGPAGSPERFCHSLSGPVKIPADRYFVTGDNYTNSFDSRYYGYLERDSLRGAPIVRFWPLSRFGKIR